MQTSPPRSILDGRRTALVTAAIREFAAAGYLAASTNRIVEAAGVSKGLLFHHFGDKNGLYMETVQTYITELMSRFDERLGRTRPDLFERLRQYALAKWPLVEEEPSTLAFLQEAMTDPPAELRDALARLDSRDRRLNLQETVSGDRHERLQTGPNRRRSHPPALLDVRRAEEAVRDPPQTTTTSPRERAERHVRQGRHLRCPAAP